MLLQTRWEQVEQLYHDNLVQAIGLRDCTVYQLQQLMASSKIVPSVISVEVHPFYKNEELVSFCKKKVQLTSSMAVLQACLLQSVCLLSSCLRFTLPYVAQAQVLQLPAGAHQLDCQTQLAHYPLNI